MRIGPSLALAPILVDFGVSPERVLCELNIAPELFSHPDNAVPYPTYCRLMARCVELTGREDLGLLIGERAGASSLGLAGFLSKQEPTVRSSLTALVDHLHHSDRGAIAFLEDHGDTTSLGYSIFDIRAEAQDQIYDGAMAIAINILRQLCGKKWSPVEVMLSRPVPSSIARYSSFFGSEIRFNAERSAIVFNSHWLDQRVPVADPELRRILKEQIDILDAEETDIVERLRRIVRTNLLDGKVLADDICAELGLSKRSLSRRLKLHGTSYQDVVCEVQFERARHLLKSTSLTLTRIALALGFSEASAFSRAFHQWSGSAPRDWRSAARSDARLLEASSVD
jgi:AraC-like DNA-binding protein